MNGFSVHLLGPKPKPPGVARQQVSFFCFAKRKKPKKRRPWFAAPSGFPRKSVNKRGCATRPSGAHKTCPTAELRQCSPKPPLVGEISRRRTGERKSKAVLCGHAHAVFFGRWALCAHLRFGGFVFEFGFCFSLPVRRRVAQTRQGQSDEYV